MSFCKFFNFLICITVWYVHLIKNSELGEGDVLWHGVYDTHDNGSDQGPTEDEFGVSAQDVRQTRDCPAVVESK